MLSHKEESEHKFTGASLVHAAAKRGGAIGASLEVELGEVGGKDGVHAPGVRTNPAEAKKLRCIRDAEN